MTVDDVVRMGNKFVRLGLAELHGIDRDGNPIYRVTDEGRRFIRQSRREHRIARLQQLVHTFWADPWLRYVIPLTAALAVMYGLMCLTDAVARAHGVSI